MSESGATIVIDLEVYRNLFCVGWYNVDTEAYFQFDETDLPALSEYVERHSPYFVTFNGQHYDLRILKYALQNHDDADIVRHLKIFSDHIIRPQRGDENKELFDSFWWGRPNIDLKLVLGGRNCPSLKKLAYRLHLAEVETLPVDPAKTLTDDEKAAIRRYNKVDIRNTVAVYRYCQEALELRRSLTKTFRADLTSASDSQIAERVLGGKGRAPAFDAGYVRPMGLAVKDFRYDTRQLQTFYERLMGCGLKFEQGFNPVKRKPTFSKFFLEGGEKRTALELDDIVPPCHFRFGGLHSAHDRYQEGDTAYDVDVTSFYPNLILKYKLYPEGVGDTFTRKYGDILARRVAAKKDGRKTEADALKIVLNSTFGKFNEFYSSLRDPVCGAAVCLNGELAILRLMDLCFQHGIEVLLVNTDGILTRQDPAAVVSLWQDELRMPLEVKRIVKFRIKDSNNHVLLYEDGTRKVKGSAFAYEKSIAKESNFPVINKAIVAHLLDGVPLESTIMAADVYLYCGCYSKGFTIERAELAPAVVEKRRLVKGEPGVEVPPVVRYYLATGSDQHLWRKNAKGWTRLADTEGVKMLNKVTGFPADINYQLYIDKAKERLKKICK